MDPDILYRLGLIRDSLIGVSYHLPDEVTLFPFLDNLLLLHQKPLVFAIWEGDACIYSSLQDPEVLSRREIKWNSAGLQKIPLGNTPFTLSVHSFSTKLSEKSKTPIALDLDATATLHTQKILEKIGLIDLPDAFFTALGQSIASQCFKKAAATLNSPPLIQMEYSEVQKLLDPFRAALDGIFSDFFRSSLLKLSDHPCPNIFVVVRTCPDAIRRYKGFFNYTAGLLLLSQMKEALRKQCDDLRLKEIAGVRTSGTESGLNSDYYLKALERPLDKYSRSVSDLVFSSGIVDFGRSAQEEGWDASMAGESLDQERRAIEKHVYPEGQLFYIPIHVGGSPWLALFTFTKEDPAKHMESWHHNYSFYRDLAQKAADLIRQEAHTVYANLVADTLVNQMKSTLILPSERVIKANREFQKVAQVYPFPLITLCTGGGEHELRVPGREVFCLKFAQNPFFRQQVDWKLGDEKAILHKCYERIGRFAKLEVSIQTDATAQISHLLKVPLRVLRSIASNEDEAGQKIHRHIDTILALHDAASALVSEKKQTQISGFKRSLSGADLKSLLVKEYDSSIQYLSDSRVSGPIGQKLKGLLNHGCAFLDIQIPNTLQDAFIFYQEFLAVIIDGLLLNALAAIDPSEPHLRVEFLHDKKSKNIYFAVTNSTPRTRDELIELTRNLNSPGPDLVGITSLHLVSKACWPDSEGGLALLWSVPEQPRRIMARALIAEAE